MQAIRNWMRFPRNYAKIVKHDCVFLYHLNAPSLYLNRIKIRNNTNVIVQFSSSTSVPDDLVDANTFEKVCEETLESLTEYFEQIVEDSDNFKTGDVSYSTGVLTVNLGPEYGIYVINRQTPNRQIWLSSPISGPKRYDFIVKDNCWIYKHDGRSLHELLQNEISKISKTNVNFANCTYSKL